MTATYEMMKQALSSETHFNILQDLIEFTGLNEEEIIKRVMRKPRTLELSADGWFDEEYDFYNPQSERELKWFYVTSQSYLFSNARKSTWLPVFDLKKHDEPILDYGAGIGTNIVYLAKQNIRSWYYELGYLQTLFFQFRMVKRGLTFEFLPARTDWTEFSNGFFKTVILQHVLEHIPDYESLLVSLIRSVQKDGRIIEESPFSKLKGLDKRRMHLPDKVGLTRVMVREGMTLEKTVHKTVNIWRKRK